MKSKSYLLCECCKDPILDDAQCVVLDGTIAPQGRKKAVAGKAGEKTAYHKLCLAERLGYKSNPFENLGRVIEKHTYHYPPYIAPQPMWSSGDQPFRLDQGPFCGNSGTDPNVIGGTTIETNTGTLIETKF